MISFPNVTWFLYSLDNLFLALVHNGDGHYERKTLIQGTTLLRNKSLNQ